MSGKRYSPTSTAAPPTDGASTDTDDEDPFDDEAVTAVIDAAWNDLSS